MEGHGEGHHEGRRGRGRSLLCLPAGRVHNFSRWRDKQKAPRGDGRNIEARDEHGQVPRVLLHEKIHRRPKKDGFLHHERDEKAREGQPADENHMEEKVCQNPGRNKSLAQGAVGQKDQKLPLRVFEQQHGRSRDRVRRG